MGQAPGYLVRYGLMGHLGKFPGPQVDVPAPRRGEAVVVHTDRGLEVGEVLLTLEALAGPAHDPDGRSDESTDHAPAHPRLLRVAREEDLASQSRSRGMRGSRFAVCRQILEESGWDVELLDVEVLMDQKTTVLHLLGLGARNFALLRARFRDLSDFDVVPEFVGPEIEEEHADARDAAPAARAGRCGDCDCGEGGCGSGTRAMPTPNVPDSHPEENAAPAGACVPKAHAGCSSCGVSQWRTGKRLERN